MPNPLFYQYRFSRDENPHLHIALGYLAVQWSIFPLEPGTKTPLIDWRTFQNRWPTTDEVFEWWINEPKAGIAVATGQISNLIVLNCDTARAQQAVYEASPADQKYMAAATFKGSHFYFRWQPGVGCVEGNCEQFGVVGEGGYVVLPPSPHPSGEKYRWMHPHFAIPRMSDRLLGHIQERQALKLEVNYAS